MDDGGSQIVAGLILLTIFLVLEFILTAFLSALDTVSESDIKEKDGTKAEWLLKIRDNFLQHVWDVLQHMGRRSFGEENYIFRF